MILLYYNAKTIKKIEDKKIIPTCTYRAFPVRRFDKSIMSAKISLEGGKKNPN